MYSAALKEHHDGNSRLSKTRRGQNAPTDVTFTSSCSRASEFLSGHGCRNETLLFCGDVCPWLPLVAKLFRDSVSGTFENENSVTFWHISARRAFCS